MIKFETINNQLCRMVEPTPLTDDVKFPCVVRLIQDDSPMGRYNQSYSEYRYGVRLGCCMLPIIATHIAKNGVVNDIEWDVSRYEIIGYPVEEGSAEWALWQMEQGKKVCHKSYTMKTTHCAINDESQVVIFTTPYSVANGGDVVCHADEWLDHRQYGCGVDERTGWHLYEPQPEPKPEHPAINGYNRYDYIPVEGIRQPKPEPIVSCIKCDNKDKCPHYDDKLDHCIDFTTKPEPKVFETINGTLCRMVEPEPLTETATFPCVVRLIQDDSPMGRYNLKLRNMALEPLVVTGIAKDIGVVTHLVPRPHFSCECYEIIGYPVADGSAEWALYQIRSGKKVVKEGGGEQYGCSLYKNRLFYLNDYGYLVTKNAIGLIDPCSEEKFLSLDETGWQLYEPAMSTAKQLAGSEETT